MNRIPRSTSRSSTALALLGAALLLGAPLRALEGSLLGAAGRFTVMGSSSIRNAGKTAIRGDVGISPGKTVQGIPHGAVAGGKLHIADAVAAQAHGDLVRAYSTLARQPAHYDLSGWDLGALGPLGPAVYQYSASCQLTGTLILDARFDPRATFIFKIGDTLRTSMGAKVQVINDPSHCAGDNVYWQVGGSALLRKGTTFMGSVLALDDIYLNPKVTLRGRALTLGGRVSLESCTLSACDVPNRPLRIQGKGEVTLEDPMARTVSFECSADSSLADPGTLRWQDGDRTLVGRITDMDLIRTDEDGNPALVRLSGCLQDAAPGEGTFSFLVAPAGPGQAAQVGLTLGEDPAVPLGPLVNGFIGVLP